MRSMWERLIMIQLSKSVVVQCGAHAVSDNHTQSCATAAGSSYRHQDLALEDAGGQMWLFESGMRRKHQRYVAK